MDRRRAVRELALDVTSEAGSVGTAENEAADEAAERIRRVDVDAEGTRSLLLAVLEHLPI
ncbi:hypothetical protein ACFQL0_22605 [Haloplanus litoreus]|uniref:hypothetical protein n=1 Tax=Haloplanus litoreus TaxID=767515 RepID=UPI003605E48C